MEAPFCNLIPFSPFLLTQFNSSSLKLISQQAGVLKLDSSVYAAQLNSSGHMEDTVFYYPVLF
jgi:hypothetical protein